MGIARLLPLLVLLVVAAAHAKAELAFKRTVADTEVDWSAGTITAQAGAAADIRMPNPNAARPGAERRARALAEDKLRAAVHVLVPGQKLDEKSLLDKAAVSRIEYQSNGGVVLWLALRFADLVPAKPATMAFKTTSARFEFAPTFTAAGKELQPGYVTYRPASESPKGAITLRRDERGRLALPSADAKLGDSLAGAAVVIYLDKAQP
jgi:hypothetical protein